MMIALRISRTAVLAVLVTVALAFAQGESLKPARITPGELTWTPNPRGFDEANLVGDPTKPGMYASHVRFARGLRIQPHFHPDDRIVTVLSGTVYVGYGEQFDKNTMRALPAGSVWTEPAKQPHFAWAKDGEVILQVIGNGPSGTTPIPAR